MTINSVSASDGGPVTAAVSLARGLQERGHEVSLFATNARNARSNMTAQEALDAAVTCPVPLFVSVRHRANRFGFSTGLLWRTLIAGRCADVLVVHGVHLWASFVSYFVARAYGKPYILQPHGSLSVAEPPKSRGTPRWWAWRLFGKALVANADTIVVASEQELTACALWAPQTKFAVSALGADGVGSAACEQPRSRRIDDGFNVIFLGRISPIKRIDLILKAWAIVKQELPDAHLSLAGSDREGYLTRVMADAPVGSSDVEYLGEVGSSEKYALLAAADAVLLVSDHENYGLAAAEGMLAGAVPIVRRTVGLADMVRLADAGLVVDTAEPDELANAMLFLAKDQERRETLSARAHAFARTSLTWAAHAERVEALLHECVTARVEAKRDAIHPEPRE